MIKMSKKLDSKMKELKKSNAETFFHLLRVKKLVLDIIERTNRDGLTDYSADEVDAICKGALLHDIGKLYVNNFILTKDTYLTPEEKAAIQQHVDHGYDIVKDELEPDEKEFVTNICRYHHERIDGSGYKELTDLPLYVQIVSVCDVFDSLYSDRIYRDGFTPEKTMEMIRGGACGGFDETLIDYMQKVSDYING